MIRWLAAPAVLVVLLVVAAPAGAAPPVLRLAYTDPDNDIGPLDPQTPVNQIPAALSLLSASCTMLTRFPGRSGASGDVALPDGAAGYPRVSREDGRTPSRYAAACGSATAPR